jgi:hypothetical protein
MVEGERWTDRLQSMCFHRGAHSAERVIEELGSAFIATRSRTTAVRCSCSSTTLMSILQRRTCATAEGDSKGPSGWADWPTCSRFSR